MSFFDDADEPRRATPRPRRPSPARRPAGDSPDQQTLMVRRLIAAGVGVLFLILIILGVKSCMDSRKRSALKDYNRNVAAIVGDSDTQVSKPFFQALSSGAGQLDLQTQVNGLKSDAAQLVKRAKALDVPSEMKAAQQNLVLTLGLRREAMEKIADNLQAALGSRNPTAPVTRIAAEMQAFLASDVVYDLRVAPFIKQSLDENGVSGQEISDSQSLPNQTWLQPSNVASRLSVNIKNGGSSGNGKGTVAPGLHGHQLDSTTANGVALTAGTANRIPLGKGVTFTVKFTNGGENDETDVGVKVSVLGSGKPLIATKTVPSSKAGAQTSVDIALGSTPPIGTAVTIHVQIVKVPGEKKLDNNTADYPALFTR